MKAWWDKYFVTAATNPVMALHAAFLIAIYTGLAWAIASLVAERKRELTADLRLFANEMAMIIFIVSLLAGGLAMVYLLLDLKPDEPPDDEKFLRKIRRLSYNPFSIFKVGVYALPAVGLIHIALLMIEVHGFGELLVWTEWVTQLFYLLTGVLILIAVRALLISVSGVVSRPVPRPRRRRRAAPSGGAEESPSAATAADTEEDKPADTADSSETENKERGPNRVEGWLSHISTWQQQLHYGTIVLAYLGLVFVALNMWRLRDSSPRSIWSTFFFELAIVAGAVGIVMLLTRFAKLGSGEAESQEIKGDDTLGTKFYEMMSDPARAALPVLLAVGAMASAWGLINIWSQRNAGVDDFWAEVTFTSFRVLAAITIPLVFWSLWKVFYDADGTRPGPKILYEPVRLMSAIIYGLIYLGLIDFCLHMLIFRDLKAEGVWWIATEDLFTTAAVVGVVVGIRAVLAAASLRQERLAAAAAPAATSST